MQFGSSLAVSVDLVLLPLDCNSQYISATASGLEEPTASGHFQQEKQQQ